MLRRSPLSIACAAVWIGLVLCGAPRVHAQTFAELGGGSSYLGPAAGADSYGRAFNVRASLGRELSSDLSIRFDGFTNQFTDHTFVPSHLNNPFGSSLAPVQEAAGVAGLSVDAIAGIDSRGIFYLLGGAGVYDAFHGRAFSFSTGALAGAGIAVPVSGRVRIFVEARKDFLFGPHPAPAWLVPLTAGFRF
jgi:hypothetical protein